MKGSPTPYYKIGVGFKQIMVFRKEIKFLLIIVIFYAGSFKFFSPGYSPYLVDYLLRGVIIALIWKDLPVLFRKVQLPKTNLWLLFVLVLGLDLGLYPAIYSQEWAQSFNNYFFKPMGYYYIQDPYLFAFDISVGVSLVAITEEMVFRYKSCELFKNMGYSPLKVLLLSSLLFASIHIIQGPLAFVHTFLWGVFYFYLYRRSGSIHFVVLAHLITDICVFSRPALGF